MHNPAARLCEGQHTTGPWRPVHTAARDVGRPGRMGRCTALAAVVYTVGWAASFTDGQWLPADQQSLDLCHYDAAEYRVFDPDTVLSIRSIPGVDSVTAARECAEISAAHSAYCRDRDAAYAASLQA